MPTDRLTGYNSKHREAARKLRREMTQPERHLWYCFLRDYPVKVYRQRPIDRFIVDFYCSKAHLVIELDGSQHYTVDGMAYDKLRTELLEKYRLEVIRFSNLEIENHFAQACAFIDKKIKEGVQQWQP